MPSWRTVRQEVEYKSRKQLARIIALLILVYGISSGAEYNRRLMVMVLASIIVFSIESTIIAFLTERQLIRNSKEKAARKLFSQLSEQSKNDY
jgi:hypothetical protein